MTARVASVHYAPVHADRSIYGGLYDMPAVALGADPAIIVIEDRVQRDEGPVSMGPGGGRRVQLRNHVDGYEIAFDIVSEWTTNGLGRNPQSHPGIWVIRDRMPVYRTDEFGKEQAVMDGLTNKQVMRSATPEEATAMWAEDLASARAADRAYAEWCYLDGNRMAVNPIAVPLIPKMYKRAARQYGFEADWLKEGAAFEVAKCPMCDKVVSKATIVCPHCQQVVNLEAYAQREAQKQAAVRSAMAQADAHADRINKPGVASDPLQPRAFRNNPAPPKPELVGA